MKHAVLTLAAPAPAPAPAPASAFASASASALTLALTLALALATSSCAKPPAPGPVPLPAAPPPAPTAPRPPPPPISVLPLPSSQPARPDLCALARADFAAVSSDVVANAPALPYADCWASPSGAWSLSLDASGAWAAVHVDANGVTTRLARRFDAGTGADPDGPTIPSFGHVERAWAEAYDFDGDGELELFVGILGIWSTHTGLELAESVLYTFKNGAIVRYAPAAKIAIWKLEDVDGDGRPDLRTSSPYSSSRGGSTPVFSPDLVAHSLPDGTFSMNDAVATAFMRKVCPKKPALSSLTAAITGDREAHGRDLACARVWGVTEDAIVKVLRLDPAAPDTWPWDIRIAPPTRLMPR